MKLDKKDLELYAVTDRAWLNGRNLEDDVLEAILGGATIIQLREKDITDEEFIEIAFRVKKVCNEYKIPFIINDNLNVMLAVDADGIHVGQSDIEASFIRSKIGKDKILGVSCQTAIEAIKAEEAGADYLGVGSIFNTSTKKDALEVSVKTLRDICDKTRIPVIAIGGINLNNIKELKNTMIDGVAVISAIFKQNNIKEATMLLRKEVEKIIFNGDDYSLYILDYDGTIIDSMDMWSTTASRFVLACGKTPKADIDEKTKTFSNYEAAKFIKEEYNFNESALEMLEKLNDFVLKTYPTIDIKEGARCFLEKLYYLKKKVVLLSASSLELLNSSLEALNIKKYFSEIYSTSDLKLSKESGSAFQYVLDIYKNEKTIVVEDAPHAVKGGKKVGLKVLGISDEFTNSDEVVDSSDYYYNIRRLQL